MKTLDTIDDRLYALIQFANKRAGYEKIKYNPEMTIQSDLQLISLLKEAFFDDPEILKELEKIKYLLERMEQKTIKNYERLKQEDEYLKN